MIGCEARPHWRVEMLVLTTFLAIGTLFIAFLLRFLFALETEAQLHTGRERQDRLYIRRVLFPVPAHSWAKGPDLARSSPTLAEQSRQALWSATPVDSATTRITRQAS